MGYTVISAPHLAAPFHRFRHCALFELLTQRPNHTIAATTPHPLNASALAQSVAMPVSHGTFQPCASMSVASVSSFIGRSQPNKLFALPLSYSAQERPLSQTYAPCGCEARCHAYGRDGWESNPPKRFWRPPRQPWNIRPYMSPLGHIVDRCAGSCWRRVGGATSRPGSWGATSARHITTAYRFPYRLFVPV